MKTKALISCAVTAQMICTFVFAYAKGRFSHDAAHFLFQISTLFYIRQLDPDIDMTLQEACLTNFTGNLDLFQYSTLVVCPQPNPMTVQSVTVFSDVDYLCPPMKQIVTSQNGDFLCGKGKRKPEKIKRLFFQVCKQGVTNRDCYRNYPKFSNRLVLANIADPNQNAPRGAV